MGLQSSEICGSLANVCLTADDMRTQTMCTKGPCVGANIPWSKEIIQLKPTSLEQGTIVPLSGPSKPQGEGHKKSSLAPYGPPPNPYQTGFITNMTSEGHEMKMTDLIFTATPCDRHYPVFRRIWGSRRNITLVIVQLKGGRSSDFNHWVTLRGRKRLHSWERGHGCISINTWLHNKPLQTAVA